MMNFTEFYALQSDLTQAGFSFQGSGWVPPGIQQTDPELAANFHTKWNTPGSVSGMLPGQGGQPGQFAVQGYGATFLAELLANEFAANGVSGALAYVKKIAILPVNDLYGAAADADAAARTGV